MEDEEFELEEFLIDEREFLKTKELVEREIEDENKGEIWRPRNSIKKT